MEAMCNSLSERTQKGKEKNSTNIKEIKGKTCHAGSIAFWYMQLISKHFFFLSLGFHRDLIRRGWGVPECE